MKVYKAKFTAGFKYVLATDDEDAAWQAYKLSKELNTELLDIQPQSHGTKEGLLR